MLTDHTAPQSHRIPARTSGTDWSSQVRLAAVMSAAAVIVTVGLGDRLPAPVLPIGIFLAASVVAWHRLGPVERVSLTPPRARRR